MDNARRNYSSSISLVLDVSRGIKYMGSPISGISKRGLLVILSRNLYFAVTSVADRRSPMYTLGFLRAVPNSNANIE